jgi:hypothetical protein
MLTRREILSVPPALATLALPRVARAEPRYGQAFPAFSVRDLHDRWHSQRDLVGRRTVVIAITGTGAGDHLSRWLDVIEARLGRAVPLAAMLAFALPFFAWDGIVRSRARAETPRWLWGTIWIDRDGTFQRSLGLPHDNNIPWAYVVERTGVVSVAIHATASNPSAQLVFNAMAAP